MKCASLAHAPVAIAAVVACAACGDSFSWSGATPGAGDGDGAATLDGGVPDANDPGQGGITGPADGASGDAAPEACAPLGSTRACSTSGKTGVQTCVPREGAQTWTTCAPTDCSAPSPLPNGASAACVGPGTFLMGGLQATPGPQGGAPYAAEADTMPAHAVMLSHRYYLDQYEVSVAELDAWWNGGAPVKPPIGKVLYVSGAGDVLRWTPALDAAVTAPGVGASCTYPQKATKGTASINCVTYETALAYCAAHGARLPTEAEWEYAALGQTEANVFPWGNDAPSYVEERSCLRTIDTVCNKGPNAGTYPFPRGFTTDGNTDAAHGSINNLAGNYAEWTLDFAPTGGASCAGSDCWPAGSVDPWNSKDRGAGLVIRGGSYLSSAAAVRVRSRAFLTSDMGSDPSMVGFRCVRTD